MKNQTFRMTMLFDFMGSFSPTARRNSSICTTTRTCPCPRSRRTTASPVRGVRDVIVRAENYMTEIEDKTGLIKRFMQLQPHVEKDYGRGRADQAAQLPPV